MAAILAAILPVLLSFVMGLIGKYSQTTIEDVQAPAGKVDELNAALGQWKKETGAP
jgi:hypothetical protein